MTALAYDAAGTGLAGALTSFSESYTAAPGADVFWALVGDRPLAPAAAQYNGVAATLVDHQDAAGNTGLGAIYWYRAAGAGDGNPHNITGTCNNAFIGVCPVSVLGVNPGSITTIKTNGTGAGTNLSSGPITLAANQIALCAFGFANDAVTTTMTLPTGGTNVYFNGTTGNHSSGLGISYSTTTATFGAALSRSTQWATITLILTQATQDVDPSGIGSGETFGSPVVAIPGIVQPASIPSGEAFGAATVTGGAVALSPTAIGSSEAFGSPLVSRGLLDEIFTALDNGADASLLDLGDSADYGSFDAEFSSVNGHEGFPTDGTALYGTFGRLVRDIGMAKNANVKVALLRVTAASSLTTKWNYPSGSPYYDAPVTIYTAVGSGRPTLTLYHGGWPGCQTSDLQARISTIIPISNPGAVFINTGFNDLVAGLTASQFATAMVTFVGSVRTSCPSAPIIVTTENKSSGSFPTSSFTPGFSALTTALVGSALPLSPALQASGSMSNVYALDTRPAFPDASLSSLLTTADGIELHPDADGYRAMSSYILGVLAPQIALVIAAFGIPSTEAFGSATVAPGAVDVDPSGIGSGEAFGTAAVGESGIIAPPSIASGEAFGAATVTPGAVDIEPPGIGSSEALGTPGVAPGAVDISPTGVGSGEAFGSADVAVGAAPSPADISPTGIDSDEDFGSATVAPSTGPVDVIIPANRSVLVRPESRTALV